MKELSVVALCSLSSLPSQRHFCGLRGHFGVSLRYANCLKKVVCEPADSVRATVRVPPVRGNPQGAASFCSLGRATCIFLMSQLQITWLQLTQVLFKKMGREEAMGLLLCELEEGFYVH